MSTSLVTITNDLHDSGQSSWIITSYLLTYTGTLSAIHSLTFPISKDSNLRFLDYLVQCQCNCWCETGHPSRFVHLRGVLGWMCCSQHSQPTVRHITINFILFQEIRANFTIRIICRAFQGLGGAGVYSLNLYAFVRIFPFKHFDKASSFAGGISSLGLVLGPVLGGIISNNGNWRWVFLYKYVPCQKL